LEEKKTKASLQKKKQKMEQNTDKCVASYFLVFVEE
jgi:hypothetical protein